MAIDQKDIRAGLPVRHLHQPEKIGVLTGARMQAVVLMAEVKWADQTQFEAVQALEAFNVDEDSSLESLVRHRRYGQIESLQSLMTFEKLSGSLSNMMYSMGTAEIEFFAHQFVPVLKFVNSPLSRLLIADEVGLGKTIEAGLIWTECRARFRARRLLVICPPSLVPKWIRELQDRFFIDAEFADAKALRARFKRFENQGPTQSFALVSSYHALRPRKAEKRLLQPWISQSSGASALDDSADIDEWKPRPAFLRSLLEWDGVPFVDLVVFDEAHLMKNTATANHVVGEIISTAAQSVLALSATPLTTKNRDLYALLKLVDPDMFRDESSFNELRQRNRPAVHLATELSKASINVERCLYLVDQIPASTARSNLRERLAAIADPSRILEEEIIALQSSAGRLNELGSFLTRTRKLEIKEHKATRKAVTLEVQPTAEELVFYNSVIRLIRQRVAERGDVLSLFHLIAPTLAMSSCLPVMAEKLRSGSSKWGDLGDLADLGNAYNEEESSFVGENQTALLDDRSWLPNYDFEASDTKYSALLSHLLHRSQDEKIIIFAFFKDTLAYLERRLESDGLSCLLVTGDTTDTSVRDKLLRDFERPRHRILLCSEVAAEGVDLQFCRVIVNYDLPWNPMRVEQRIGRIDRIGQKAQTILIINFYVRGTIDGSIYHHLHRNIGLFHDTIGDLEGILGPQVNQLTRQLLIDELSPAQVEEKIKQTAAAIARERALVAEIDEQAETLLGLRSYLQGNVRRGYSLGRYLKPSELRLYAADFFQETYIGADSCQLNWDSPADGCLRITMSYMAFTDYEDYLNRQALPWPKGFTRDSRQASLTFDPEIYESSRRQHRNLALANHLHPFVRWMTSAYGQRRKSWHPASAVRLDSNDVAEGTYFYMISRVSLKHIALSKEELLFRAQHIVTGGLLGLQESESLVNQSIDKGGHWTPATGFPDCSKHLEAVTEALAGDCTEIHLGFKEELELRLNSKQAQVESHFEARIESASRRLDAMLQSNQDRERGIRVTRSQIKHLQSRLRDEREKLDNSIGITPDFKRIACGLVKVNRIP